MAFSSASLAGVWAAVEAGLGITLRTPLCLPRGVRVLDPQVHGLPAMPTVALHLHRASDSLRVDFVVTDRIKEMPVEYNGILPDLFREGQSIIATGKIDGGRFVATQVLAKHDETYMPREVRDAIEKAKAAEAKAASGSAAQ